MKSIKSLKAILAMSVVGGIVFSSPALAVISNTVTVDGTDPNNNPVTASATETVDVADAVYQLSVQSFDQTPAGPVEARDNVVWSIVYRNTGNVTLYDITPGLSSDGADKANEVVALSSLNDGLNTITGDSVDANGADLIIDKLAPGDEVTYTLTLNVKQIDVDEDADRTLVATANRGYAQTDGGTTVNPGAVTDSVDLVAQAPAMTISKLGYRNYGTGSQAVVNGTTDNVPAGETITYEYIIENTGNTTLEGLVISDSHGGEGTDPVPDIDQVAGAELTKVYADSRSKDNFDDNRWSYLAPGDTLKMTATYTVVEQDIVLHQ